MPWRGGRARGGAERREAGRGWGGGERLRGPRQPRERERDPVDRSFAPDEARALRDPEVVGAVRPRARVGGPELDRDPVERADPGRDARALDKESGVARRVGGG